MNKLVEDLFKFLRNIIEFIKIVDIFFVMMSHRFDRRLINIMWGEVL